MLWVTRTAEFIEDRSEFSSGVGLVVLMFMFIHLAIEDRYILSRKHAIQILKFKSNSNGV